MGMITVVIPVHNAAALIENACSGLCRFLEKNRLGYEILFCDDASSDGSRCVIAEMARQYSNIRYFHHEKNTGLGGSLRDLFERAEGEKVIYMDVDLPFGTDVVKEIAGALESCDIALASRYKGAKNRIPFARKIMSRIYRLLCRAMFRIEVQDIGSGTVGFRKEALRALNLTSDGFAVHAEIFTKSLRAGLRVKEIPVPSNPPLKGSFSILKHSIPVIKETLKLKRRLF